MLSSLSNESVERLSRLLVDETEELRCSRRWRDDDAEDALEDDDGEEDEDEDDDASLSLSSPLSSLGSSWSVVSL
ncbi:hypothetical protein ATCC90586_006883 [Pythium insidiosum]|nr:hypothetical protein ATCC90586_006883 [Pythium insidiosum]